MNPEIAQSWLRSKHHGLKPEDDVRVELLDYDKDSRLLSAAGPVLDEVRQQIDAVPVGVILANHRAVIVRREFGDGILAGSAERVGAGVGAVFDERHSGTNAIATPFESRRALLIRDGEHYLERMKHFVCYGSPIINPVTHRVEGVLDLMAPANTDTALMRAVVHRAIRDILTRLRDDYDEGLVAMVALFNAMRRSSRHALILLSEDLVLQNSQALDLLSTGDVTLLRCLTRALHIDKVLNLELSNSRLAEVSTRFSGSDGAIFQIRIHDENSARIPRAGNARNPSNVHIRHQVAAAREKVGHVLICGEPGTGRSTVAREIAGPRTPIIQLRCGGQALDELQRACAEALHHVVVDGLDLVDDDVFLRHLEAMLRESQHPRFILAGGPTGERAAGLSLVAAACAHVIELSPLRERIDEIPALLDSMLESPHAPRVRVTLGVIDLLQTQTWPGNLSELRMVVDHITSVRSAGDVTAADLPARYRVKPARANLTVLERAERDAILRILRVCQGNKVHAAQELGLSRSTLYQRLRYFGMT